MKPLDQRCSNSNMGEGDLWCWLVRSRGVKQALFFGPLFWAFCLVYMLCPLTRLHYSLVNVRSVC